MNTTAIPSAPTYFGCLASLSLIPTAVASHGEDLAFDLVACGVG